MVVLLAESLMLMVEDARILHGLVRKGKMLRRVGMRLLRLLRNYRGETRHGLIIGVIFRKISRIFRILLNLTKNKTLY